MNKLIRFASFVVFTALTSVGCAHNRRPVDVTPTPPVVDVKQAPPAHKAAFTIGPVDGWTLVEESEMEGVEPQRVAEYEYQVDESLTLSTYVTQFKLDVAESSEFLNEMRSALNEHKNIKVIGQRMSKRGDLEAYEVLAALKLNNGVALILGVAVVDQKGNAFYVTCGGNIKGGEAVINACMPLIKSFRVAN